MPELCSCSLVSLALACTLVLVLPQTLLDTVQRGCQLLVLWASACLPGGPLPQEWGVIYLTTPASWATQF